jgi:hypothetical protein
MPLNFHLADKKTIPTGRQETDPRQKTPMKLGKKT